MLVPLLAFLLWLPVLVSQEQYFFSFDHISPMPLYHFLNLIIKGNSLLSTSLGIITLLGIVILLTRLNKQFVILETRSYYLALIYIFLVSAFTPLNRMHPALIGAFFLSLSLTKVFASYKDEKLYTGFFDSAFLIGLGSLFYFPLLYFSFFLWLSLILLRPFFLKEWIMIIIGAALPYILSFAIAYLFDSVDYLVNTIRENNFLDLKHVHVNMMHILFYLVAGLLIIPAGIKMISQSNNRKVSARKYLRVLFWLSITSAAITLAIPAVSITIIPIICIPISFLFTNYFISIKNLLVGNIMLVIFILLMLGLQLIPSLVPGRIF